MNATFDFQGALNGQAECLSTGITQNYRVSEACLQLHILAPKKVLDERQRATVGAPLLVQIYAGGYEVGSDTYWGNATGLVQSSYQTGADGVIFVAINYCLGFLGFASGAEFERQGGLPNAGLYDQTLALNWMRRNIYKFGGDPNRVTVLSESAGVRSIIFQMTAYGGSQGPAPFQQVIAQRPGWAPDFPAKGQDAEFQTFLRQFGVTSLEEARHLTSLSVIAANALVVGQVPYGCLGVGPVISPS